jgi:hypothetical protein
MLLSMMMVMMLAHRVACPSNFGTVGAAQSRINFEPIEWFDRAVEMKREEFLVYAVVCHQRKELGSVQFHLASSMRPVQMSLDLRGWDGDLALLTADAAKGSLDYETK